MFGPSFVEILVILLIVLLVLGPSRLPGIARSIGRGLREVRKVQQEVRGTWADMEGSVRDSSSGKAEQASDAPSISAPGSEQGSPDGLVGGSQTEPSQEPFSSPSSADETAETEAEQDFAHVGKESGARDADEGAGEKKEDDKASGGREASLKGGRRGDA